MPIAFRVFRRSRRGRRWLALAVAASLVVLALGLLWHESKYYNFSLQTRHGDSIELMGGVLDAGRSSVAAAPFANITTHNWPHRQRVYRAEFNNWPLWRIRTAMDLPTVLAALVAAIAWWRFVAARIRTRPGLCPSCGYSRTGLAPCALCPECGCTPEASDHSAAPVA